MRSILRGALLFGVIAVLCAGLAFSVERGLTSNKGELGRASVTNVNSSATNAGHSARVQNVTREDVFRYLNTSPAEGYVPNSYDNQRAERAIDQAEYLFKTGDTAGAKSLLTQVARSDQGTQVRARLNTMAGQFGNQLTQTFGTNVGAEDALGSNCADATLVALPYQDVQDLPVPGGSNWRAFTVAGPDPEEVVISTFQSPNNDPFGQDTNLTLYAGCDVGTGTPLDEVAFNEDFGGTFLSEIAECLAPGTYYVRVGGYLDFSTWFGVEFDMFSTGTCFIPTPDEFEYDNESSYANQIGCELLAVGDPVCYPCDDDSSDSSSYGWWDDDSSDSDSSAPALCCTQPEACLILQSQCRSIFPAGDIDNVIFNVGPEPRWVTIETGPSEDCGISDEPDTLMALASASGTLIAVNDDDDVFAGGSKLEFCAPADTDYIVVILGFSAFDEFGYGLEVTTSEEPCNLELEPNGLCEDATPVAFSGEADNGYVISGTYNSGGLSDLLVDVWSFLAANNPFPVLGVGELDYYTFTINEPCYLEITSSSMDCFRSDNWLQLHSGCPDTIDNAVAAGDEFDVFCDQLGYNIEPGVQYYLWHSESPFFINPVDYFPYNLEFNCTEPPPEPQVEVEPNNTAAEGNPIELDNPVFGFVDAVGDYYDYFCFTLDADTQIEINGEGISGSTDSVIELTDPAGNQICCDDDSDDDPGFFGLIVACLPAGDYCFGVKEWGAFASDMEYAYTVFDQGACAGGPTCIVSDFSASYGYCDPFQNF